MDYRNKKELTDQNTIIYAHMMYYGDEMFGVLKHFTDQKYVDQSPKTVTLTTDQGVFTYRLFSIEHVGATDPYRIPNKPGDEFMGDMLAAYAASEADFDLSAEFNEKDRIITLSTCTTDQDESERIAVLGVLEKVETKEGTVTREEIQRAYKN